MRLFSKPFCLLALLFLTAGLNAQKLETYSGDYPISGLYFWVTGQATYTYKELPDYTKVRDGSFLFSSDMNGTEFGQSSRARFQEVVKGLYKNNAKTGKWEHYIQFDNVGGENSLTTLMANYTKGYPNGLWNLSLKSTLTNEEIETMNMNFKNGVITGAFKKANPGNGTEISGTCDANGYLDGKIVITEDGIENILEYKHGVMQMLVVRDQNSGEVIKRETTPKESLDMVAQLQEMQAKNPSELGNMNFALVTHVAKFDEKFSDAIVETMQMKDFPGDSLLLAEDGDRYQWTGFQYYSLEPQESNAARDERLKKEADAKMAEEKRIADAKAAEEKRLAEQALAREKLNQQQAELDQKREIFTEKQSAVKAKYGTKKQPIITAYRSLVNYYLEGYLNADEISEQIDFIDEGIALSDKIMGMFEAKTTDLEKKLKSASTDEEKIQIFASF